tara:strand:+ start:795 stop:3134 length:2340 start_codon:yes stop_codon:yes gene_type:complete
MHNTTSKLLKIEILALFVVTVIAVTSFYYGDALPDNLFSISSDNSALNVFSYYFSSLLAAIGYYVGPWIVLPFFIFSSCYAFIYSKRDSGIDALNAITLTLVCLVACFLFAPHTLGSGLNYLVKNYVSDFSLGSILFLGTFAFLFGTFRGSFKDFCVKTLYWSKTIPVVSYRYVASLELLSKSRNVTQKLKALPALVKRELPQTLKGEPTTPAKVKRINRAALQQTDDLIKEEPVIASSYEATEQTMDFDDIPNLDAVGNEVSTPMKDVKPRAPRVGATGGKKYYDIVSEIAHKKNSNPSRAPNDDYFADIKVRVEEKLKEFNVDAEVINVLKGPVVDTFELKLGPGVRVSKIKNAEDDLSMALMGAAIRVVYPMIGRDTVGIEVPRNPRDIIYLDEVLSTKDFNNSRSHLPIAMGKNAFGETMVVDLAAMPHMLVAGATGAGKSVFINSLLVSLLVKRSPEQMKLILIDPKQLELALYAKLPHLIMPVITDAKMASVSMLWAVQEMERRYSILKELGVRNIEGFNEKLERATPDVLAAIHQYYDNEPGDDYSLPYIVIIVDEFADLILTKAGKEIENSICRLAAKARAAGIHLVLATQRPSVDVITGLIKSNFPTRVSFKVTTDTDSRTILNTNGAEKLLGKGDMLYKAGTNIVRVHSSYVDENEIEALTDKISSEIGTNFHTAAMDFLENGGEKEQDPYSFGSHIGPIDNSDDAVLYEQAVKLVIETQAASASFLQRRLKIGYNRAARLIEEMESQGIVGPQEGAKRRKVLSSSPSP